MNKVNYCFNKKRNSFSESWGYIIRSKHSMPSCIECNYNNQIDSDLNERNITREDFFDDEKIYNTPIEYSNYSPIQPEKINSENINDCFQGILNYIYFNSENKLNTEELYFQFPNDGYSSMIKNCSNYLNIINIFHFNDSNSIFSISNQKNAFIRFNFKRIKVNPIAYSIRSGSIISNTTRLISFNFEGYDEENKMWDILDERVDVVKINSSGNFCIFYIRQTNKSYSSFRLKQTDTLITNLWGFSISAFEIHGNISLNQNIIEFDDINQIQDYSFDLSILDPNLFVF